MARRHRVFRGCVAAVLVAAVWRPVIGIAAALVLLPGRRWAQAPRSA